MAVSFAVKAKFAVFDPANDKSGAAHRNLIQIKLSGKTAAARAAAMHQYRFDADQATSSKTACGFQMKPKITSPLDFPRALRTR